MMINFRVLLGGVALAAACPAVALDTTATLQQVLSSPTALEQSRANGRKVTLFCANCHGENGNSNYDYIPNLAGQHPAYLLEQLQKFADGRRKDEFMTGMIKAMKDQDRVDVALFYAGQKVRVSSAKSAELVARGQSMFRTVCSACHGATGHGNERFARLAGQHSQYITQSLQQYRKGDGARKDPVMGSVARRLTDSDIEGLAAYIPTMP